ncbi:MAG: methyltransferase domain-containing protein [Candidatus Micrarchaeota archaeon]
MPQHYALRFDLNRFPEPWLEIDGVKMHVTSRVSPLKDAENRVRLLGVKKVSNALDVCTGLGYSAIALAKAGAKVTTIELDEHVLELAKQNKYSQGLFDGSKIRLLVGDAFELVKEFEDASFDVILHDPPRFSFAGELYSGEFYRELFRVLQKGGRLFHYTGTAGERTGKRLLRGVKERLSQAGFQRIKRLEKEMGFLAFKPSRGA